jgi:hypothetical protein
MITTKSNEIDKHTVSSRYIGQQRTYGNTAYAHNRLFLHAVQRFLSENLHIYICEFHLQIVPDYFQDILESVLVSF